MKQRGVSNEKEADIFNKSWRGRTVDVKNEGHVVDWVELFWKSHSGKATIRMLAGVRPGHRRTEV